MQTMMGIAAKSVACYDNNISYLSFVKFNKLYYNIRFIFIKNKKTLFLAYLRFYLFIKNIY